MAGRILCAAKLITKNLEKISINNVNKNVIKCDFNSLLKFNIPIINPVRQTSFFNKCMYESIFFSDITLAKSVYATVFFLFSIKVQELI